MRTAHFLHGLLVLSFVLLSAVASALADDPGAIHFVQALTGSDVVVVLKVGVSKSGPFSKVEEVLKGKLPKENPIPPPEIDSYADQDGRVRKLIRVGMESVELDAQGTGRLILFLKNVPTEPGQTGLVLRSAPGEDLRQVRDVIAMLKDPAPFVASPDYAGHLNLIRVLARQFCPRLTSPEIPRVKEYVPMSEFERLYGRPWQRTKFSVTFTYDRRREARLKVISIVGEGQWPDFVRRVAAQAPNVFDEFLRQATSELPSEFSVTLDTTGERTVGTLSSEEARAYLRGQLNSLDEAVVGEAFLALSTLSDTESVPAAIKMLKHPEPAFRIHAADFLGWSGDPRALAPISEAIDALPMAPKDEEYKSFASALGGAALGFQHEISVATLQRAVKKGYGGHRFSDLLSQRGDEASFQVLIDTLRRTETYYYRPNLRTMVQRSNLPTEEWMVEAGMRTERDEANRRLNRQWLEWWEKNKADFKIVKYPKGPFSGTPASTGW